MINASQPSGGGSNTSPLSQNRNSGVFIDWLTVSQTHLEKIPVHGKEIILRAVIESGEVKSETITGIKYEGSFSSSLIVRSDGARVTVSGNPSRLNRPHNLCGLRSLDACIELYNSVLKTLGLPPFYDSGTYGTTSNGQLFVDRPSISRIDLTQNYIVGENNVKPVISWLATQKYQRSVGHVYGDGCTVDWSRGSKMVYFKYYDKARELELHDKDKKHIDLIKFLRSVGLLRFEVSLKSNKLKKLGLDNPKSWTPEKMDELADHYQFHKRVSGTRNSLIEIADTLIELGYNRTLSHRCMSAALAWASGVNFIPGETHSKSAFYRLRKPLLDVGIDISLPSNISTLPITVREIEIKEFELPEKYSCNYD